MNGNGIKLLILLLWLGRALIHYKQKQSKAIVKKETVTNPTTEEKQVSRRLRHYQAEQEKAALTIDTHSENSVSVEAVLEQDESVTHEYEAYEVVFSHDTPTEEVEGMTFEDLSEDFEEELEHYATEFTHTSAPVAKPIRTRRSAMKQALLYHEILSKPKSLR